MYKLLIAPMDLSLLEYYSKIFNILVSWDKGRYLTFTVIAENSVVVDTEVMDLAQFDNDIKFGIVETLEEIREHISCVAEELKDKYILDYQNVLFI